MLDNKLTKEFFIRVLKNINTITLEQFSKMVLKTPAQIESWCKENFDGHTFGELKNAIWGDTALNVAEAFHKNAIENGNVIAQIFAAKNYLGMTDKVENKVEVEPITFTNDIGDEED